MSLDNQSEKSIIDNNNNNNNSCNTTKSPLSSQDTIIRKLISYDFQTQKSIIDKDPSIVFQSDSKSHNTLLFYSVRNDNYPLTEYLIEKKSNVNTQNIFGETPLQKAVENQSHKMINFLLDKGANPNLQQEFGETPMHIAASKGDYKVIKLLLLYHADPAILTTEGYLAEDYANERGNQKCVDVLAKALNQIEISDIVSSPFTAIREQFNSESGLSNGTHNNTPRAGNDYAKKKRTIEMNSNINHPNIALSNPSDDDLQTDCDNVRYNGLNNYYHYGYNNNNCNRTPNHRTFNEKVRLLDSDRYDYRNNCPNSHNNDRDKDNDHSNKVNHVYIDNDNDEDNDNDKDDLSDNNVMNIHKLPFEKINNNCNDSESWNNRLSNNNNTDKMHNHNQPLGTLLISISEGFKDLAKEQIIFYSEKNDIIEEVYLRQSTVRVSLKKNNTLKNSKFVQNTYQDEYELFEDQEHNNNNNTNNNNNYNQLETIHDDKQSLNDQDMMDNNSNKDIGNIGQYNYSTTEHLDIHPIINQSSDEERELNDYLKKIEMHQYTDLLIKQGFDDLSILLNQMKTKKGITDSNLKEAGIDKPGHRARILLKLQIDADAFEPKINEGNAFYYTDKEKSDHIKDDNLASLYQWLNNIKLNAYYSNVYNGGYHSIDLLLLQMISKNPLTEEILEKELNIPKLGYRLRLINKLSEDSLIFQSKMRIPTNNEVDFQMEVKNESCRCIIY